MRKQYIAEVEGIHLRENFITTTKPYTHAVVGVSVNRPNTGHVLGWYMDEFTANKEAAENWRPYLGWRQVLVTPVKGYPLKEGALA